MIYVYSFCDGNSVHAIAEYQQRFPNRRIPTRRAGVNAPTKSVSVPAAISVVLIFHLSLWPGSTRGRQDKVIATTTDMSA